MTPVDAGPILAYRPNRIIVSYTCPDAGAEPRPPAIDFAEYPMFETETVLDRRRLRRHLSFWRLAAIAALVIAAGRVLSIGAREPSAQVLERARPFLKRKKSNGVLFIGPNEALDEPLIRQAAACGIQGIVVMFGPGDGAAHKGPVLDVADRFRLFIAGAAADPRAAAF